eukprot:565155_1
MASENCKPTEKCLGIATLVIVGLLFFYNVALKGTSPNFDLKLNESGDHMQVTLTNTDKFPAFDVENETSTGFDIVLKAKKDDKGGEPVTVPKAIYIVPKDSQKKSVVFDRMGHFVGGSVTVTYMRGKEGFGSSTMEVPSKSNSNNNEKYIQVQDVPPSDNQQSDSYKMSLIRNDGKPQPTKAKKEDDQ